MSRYLTVVINWTAARSINISIAGNLVIRLFNLGFLLVYIVFSLPLQADSLLPFKAEYNAEIKGFAVKASRELSVSDSSHSESVYTFTFKANSWAASLEETSQFLLDSNQIKSLNYHYQQKALGKKREKKVDFDWQANTLTSINNGESHTLPLTKNFFDKLNYQLQLALDISQQNFSAQYTYEIIDKNEIKSYHFEVLGEEILETKIGKLNTIKVKALRENKNKITYLWLAKDWNYLLTQLEQYSDDKKSLFISLKKATLNHQTVTPITP